MQPARIPAARLTPSDVVPEAIDRPRKLERLGAQRGAGRRFVQFKTKKPRLRVRQVDIATSPARTLRRVQGPPTPTLQGPAQTKACFGCSVPPIYDQPTEPARFGKLNRNPGLRIVRTRRPTRAAEGLARIEIPALRLTLSPSQPRQGCNPRSRDRQSTWSRPRLRARRSLSQWHRAP